MKSTSILIVAALAVASCGRAPSKPATVPASEGGTAMLTAPPSNESHAGSNPLAATSRDIEDGVEVASAWLDALAKNDLNAVTGQTGFPFRLRHTPGDRSCAVEGIAGTPAELPAVVRCLTSDATLMGVLQAHSGGGFDALTHDDVQPWARQWRAEIQPEWRLVTAYFERGDATIELDLLVASDGVRAVWKGESLDAAVEARRATEWLAALHSGDVSSLSRITHYPFELRDRGREALCGTRAAENAAALKQTVDCLTSNKVFHEAMRDATEAPPVVFRNEDQLPDWARKWWEKKKDPGTQIVAFIVGTARGDEFDLLFLVDEGGVRALWKSGSFESTE